MIVSDYSNQYLSFGLSYKFTQLGIETLDFSTGDPDDPKNPEGLNDVKVNNSNFDIAMLYRVGRFFIGANIVNLLQKKIDDFNPTEPRKLQNYFMFTGYTFYYRFSKIEIEPSILYQSFAGDGGPLQILT